MSRIPQTFDRLRAAQRKALIPFITAGDPDPGGSVALMHALADAGADIIELGVPFSDPMADGPTIQRSSERALDRGVTLRGVLGMVREFRARDAVTPVVLMGYANPIEAMGAGAFVAAAASAGVDGVLVVDEPPEEGGEFIARLRAAGLDAILLLAPTSTEERVRRAAALGSGYIYYVALTGVTGAAGIDLAAVAQRLGRIRENVTLPVVVGFGIRDADSARRAARAADGVVIGSLLIEAMQDAGAGRAVECARGLAAQLREALDRQEDRP
ncbi:MAG TPA: tryptophan synthase subunit alpha [Rhodocyclaceae bacterium]|nr:MAG: tryptophan synthase subunit alpha [Betaproteobacteria bacterium CG2_30_68_42]PIV76919.1 MAG: tryptophan synthase subunit alpha [Rhodocyclales bacterium CG17_big_fil_post_rev_8_21_14_2_50_68_7]PIX75726.1 MAG: tryptophan synthase subunit alpha [Rhodocyclales bacterium CG_4_10_14_3_um_filter_68_10]PJA57846.1 MAG: tryptophan synthase subunit alpha [Rhodocyclales bacterium CG_4_9_14_3_um_filter_68_10]HCX32742.1 tryptophan synthase subunit alpha [Rhodocyclaceae bacterium]